MRLFASIVVSALIATGSIAAEPSTSTPDAMRSATKARDVGGFALGTHIRDVAQLIPLEALGNDNFQGVRDGISYDFAVTSKGRVYRIISTQPLGRVAIDDRFLQALARKLAAKYGTPTSSAGMTFGWSLIEPIKRLNGRTLPFETMSAAAYVQDDPDGVAVEMKLLDFRILWQDQAQPDRLSQERASESLAF